MQTLSDEDGGVIMLLIRLKDNSFVIVEQKETELTQEFLSRVDRIYVVDKIFDIGIQYNCIEVKKKE